MKEIAKRGLKKALGRMGVNVNRIKPARHFLLELFELYGVEMVFDIGANIGMTGEELRNINYIGPIRSFEPIRSLYEQCKAAAVNDPYWEVENTALGEMFGEADINVSGGHAGASSLLNMTANVLDNEPNLGVVRVERIKVNTLNSKIEQYYPSGKGLFLKIDVQGYEKNVLKGGLKHIDKVVGLKLEMSLVENYHGEPLMAEMVSFLNTLGFHLVRIENGWSNKKTHELYQVDGIFFRTRGI